MLVAWRTETATDVPNNQSTVLELIPKQRTTLDLVDRVAS